MTTPNASELNYYQGKQLTDVDWSHNFNKIIQWLTAGTYDFTLSNITVSNNLTTTGSVTATTYYGDGSNLTGLSGSTDAYVFGDLFLYNQKLKISDHIVKSSGSINNIRAYLFADNGVQFDNMSSATNWAASNADGANLAVNTAWYIEGGSSLKIDKAGTTTSSGGMQRVNLTSADLTGKKVRVTVNIPTIASGTLSNIRIWLASGGTFGNTKYWDFTTDVAGHTLSANNNQYTIEVDPALAQSGSAGAYNILLTNSIRVEIITSVNSATFTGFSVDHIVYLPDVIDLNVNLYKISTNGTLLIKKSGDSYTLPSLRGGLVTTKSTPIDNATLTKNDVLYVDITTASTNYGGYNLVIIVEMN